MAPKASAPLKIVPRPVEWELNVAAGQLYHSVVEPVNWIIAKVDEIASQLKWPVTAEIVSYVLNLLELAAAKYVKILDSLAEIEDALETYTKFTGIAGKQEQNNIKKLIQFQRLIMRGNNGTGLGDNNAHQLSPDAINAILRDPNTTDTDRANMNAMFRIMGLGGATSQNCTRGNMDVYKFKGNMDNFIRRCNAEPPTWAEYAKMKNAWGKKVLVPLNSMNLMNRISITKSVSTHKKVSKEENAADTAKRAVPLPIVAVSLATFILEVTHMITSMGNAPIDDPANEAHNMKIYCYARIVLFMIISATSSGRPNETLDLAVDDIYLGERGRRRGFHDGFQGFDETRINGPCDGVPDSSLLREENGTDDGILQRCLARICERHVSPRRFGVVHADHDSREARRSDQP